MKKRIAPLLLSICIATSSFFVNKITYASEDKLIKNTSASKEVNIVKESKLKPYPKDKLIKNTPVLKEVDIVKESEPKLYSKDENIDNKIRVDEKFNLSTNSWTHVEDENNLFKKEL